MNFIKLMGKSDFNHPNLQTIETLFEEDEYLYSVETPLNQSLNQRLEILLESKEPVAFKVRQIINWFIALCEAVDFLHSNNIIHGNICTGTIGFDESNKIKLKFNHKSFIVNTINDQVNVFDVSSLALNSPELMNTDNPLINAKYDVFCLGWLLYTMVKLKDVSHDLKTTKDFIQLKCIPQLPEATYPIELNNIFKEMIHLDWKKRPTIKKILESPFILSIRGNLVNKNKIVTIENTPNEKRYEKINILTKDELSISYLVIDIEENSRK